MADNDSIQDHQAAWIQANMGESYTQAFNIRQVMYRIQDVDLPFKHGVRVEQFLMFLGAFIVTLIVNSIIVYPMFRILGLTIPPTFHLVFWLAFPIFMAVRIGKPMPYQKTITGTAASFLRYNLDDRWHCRGLPVKDAPKTGMQGNYLRTWTVDPAYAGIESPHDLPATEFSIYTNMDLPDGPVILPGEVVDKKRILEDEDVFLDRLTAASNLGSTVNLEEADSRVSLTHDDDGEYVVVSEEAPTFDRSMLSRTTDK